MIVAIMTTALSGTVWAEEVTTYTFSSKSWAASPANWTGTKDGSQFNTSQTPKGVQVTTGVSGVVVTSPKVFTNVKKVVVTYSSSSKGVGSIEVKVGTTSMGSNSISKSQTETELTYETTTLLSGSVSFTVTCTTNSLGINAITIYEEEGGSTAVATTTTIDASGITNTDVYTSTEAGSLSATVKDNNNATITGATVTWSSSNENVATVASNGTVTLVAAGTTNITASYAGVANQYLSSVSDAYVLTVTDSTPFAGGDVTFVAGTDKGTTTTNADGDEVSKSGVTISSTKAAFATDQYRFYQDSETTISTSQGTITSIVFTQSGSYNVSNFSANTGSYSNGTWTGNVASVVFTASAQVRASRIVVTVDLGATSDPVISASDVNIGYDEESGTITYTLENEVTGGALTASSSESWLNVGTPSNGSVALTCSANTGEARTATVTLTYTYNTNETVTKEVTVTQAGAPVIYTTIPALFAAATSTATEVNITFGGWVVSAVHNKNAYLTDNQGHGLIIYTDGHGFLVGDVLTGTVTCNLLTYHGSAELTGLTTSTPGLSVTHNGTVTEQNIAISELSGVNTGALVAYEGLTYNGTALVDGNSNAITPYSTLYEGTFENGKTYNVTGIYLQYNTTKELLPRSAADIVEVQVQHNEYDLTVSNLENVEMFVFDAADDSNSLLDGEGTVQVYDGTEVMISVSAESGYVLESLTVDGNDVTSQIDESGAYTFTMPTHAVTVSATAVVDTTPTKTLTNANIVAAGDAGSSYSNWEITDENGKTWNAYAIKNKHSNATSAYHYLQIKKYASGTAYYLQVPEYGSKITSITMTVSSSSSPMTGGGNSATLYFSASNSTSAAGEGVASGTGASVVTIDCSSLNLNTGYITASGSVRIWDVTVVYEETESVTVTSAGYATFASDNALDFTGSSIKAFYATESAGTLTFHAITKVPANTGVLLYKAGGATENVPTLSGAADDVKDNVFVRGTGAKVSYDANDQNYILFNGEDGIGFYKANSNTVAANRAYIHVDSSVNVKCFAIDLEDDATGISLMEDGRSQMEDGAIYNIAGQRLDNSQFTIHNSQLKRGIYIVNGKKILK